MTPKVSVIITVYNVENYLEQCLDSIASQTLKDIEIICVDDGSTDGSLSILNSFMEKDSRFIVVHTENKGAGSARNHGMSYATGEYMVLLDSDDFFECNMLEIAYDCAEKLKLDMVVYGSDIYRQDENQYEEYPFSINRKLLPDTQCFSAKDVTQDIFKLFIGWAWDKLFRTSFIKNLDIEFQNLRTSNDMFFVFAALSQCERISVITDVLVHHRKASGGLANTREKSWHCFHDALIHLRGFLQERHDYQKFERDFINYCLHASFWNYDTLSEPAKSLLDQKLRDEWFDEFGISGKSREYFYSKKEYDKYLDFLINRSFDSKQEIVELWRKGDIVPLVSIIMPSYNVVDYIEECLSSVVNQTLMNIEIISVDAESTDGTNEIIERYAISDPRIVRLRSDVKSFGHQMNIGIEHARGQYIGIVETDDYVLPETYEMYVKAAIGYGNLDVVKSDFKLFVADPSDSEKYRYTYRKLSTKAAHYNRVYCPKTTPSLLRMNNLCQPGIYKRSFLIENDVKYNETLGASYQDNGFWFQVFSSACSAIFLQDAYYMLRRDNPNSSIHASSKVFDMCYEYDYIREILLADERRHAFLPWCALARYNNYTGTLQRISEMDMARFFARWADDFRLLDSAGELDKRLFTPQQWETLRLIMILREDYYFDIWKVKQNNTRNANKVKSLRQQVKKSSKNAASRAERRVKNSRTYKIGKTIVTPARKIKNLLKTKKASKNEVLSNLDTEKPQRSISGLSTTVTTTARYQYWESLPEDRYEEQLRWLYKNRECGDLDLTCPESFNEKIQWYKINILTDPLYCQLADKLAVREWVKDIIGEEYLIPIHGVWDSFDEIEFDSLPNQFALKTNHGCGMIHLVHDKNSMDKNKAKEQIDAWMDTNFAFCNGLELQYKNIPRKIYAEKYIENRSGDLYDYKFWCFDGRVEYIQFLSDRGTGLKMTFFNKAWEPQDFVYSYPNHDYIVPKPERLEEMILIAEKLSEGFQHVRVDLYDIDDGIMFGEMTFTSASGFCSWNPPEANYLIGSLWSINK